VIDFLPVVFVMRVWSRGLVHALGWAELPHG
jgi:hypothetical protein